jgi:hypothetical protein
LTVLFLIVGLILVAWILSIRQDSETFAHISHGFQENVAQNLPVFDRQEDQDTYYLTYDWTDFSGFPNRFSFSLLKNMVNEAEEEFGYFPADLRKHLDDLLERSREKMIEDLMVFVQELIRKSGYSEYIRVEKISSKSFTMKLSVPPPLQKKVKREFDRIKIKLAKEQEKYLKRVDKDQEEGRVQFLKDRGIRVFDGKIGVDHGFCVRMNKERLRPILEIMQENHQNLSLHQFLSLLLSFVQDIRYYIPPVQERGKIILSFWVPPRVLADNFGDCDSKGVTFASCWINFKKYPILLITVPKHFFIGLGVPSFTGEGLVVNGVRYTLCEVTGPGKMPPGMIGRYSKACLQNGQYVYELVN